MKELRKHQLKSHEASFNSYKKGIAKQLNVMATGTGKTYTEVKLIEKYTQELQFTKPKLWITHNETLLEQSAIAYLSESIGPEIIQNIESRGGFLNYVESIGQHGVFAANSHNKQLKVGVIKADIFKPQGDIVFASAQTLHRRLDKLDPNMFDMVICDEAHLFGAPTFVKSIQYFQPKLLRGLTATPYRTDGMLLGNIFDEITFDYDIGTAIKEGNLCELDAIRVKTTMSLDNVKSQAGEFNQRELSNELNTPARNQLVAASYLKYAKDRQGIVFCVDSDHAVKMKDVFLDNGINCEVVLSDEEITTDRRGVIQRYKAGKIQVLINCMILVAGLDHPNTGAIVMACPTKSLTKYLQAAGRGTRLKDQNFVDRFGQNCIIIDVIDATQRHQLVNAWELDRTKDPNDRVFTTQEKKDLLNAERQKRNTKIDVQRDQDERVDLLKLPKVKLNKSIRMTDPATEKQLEAIKKMGYDPTEAEYTKGMINEIFAKQSASVAQINALKYNGYDISRGVTIAEASMAFKEIEERKNRKVNNSLANLLPFTDI